MGKDAFNLSVILMFFQNVLTTCYTAQRYEIVIYKKIETRNSSLSCLFCFNGDDTNDCRALRNISAIPHENCKLDEPYCKVRRLSIHGKLRTFDRYCAKHCEPGCREGAYYHECVSCCNEESLCNVDDSATSLHRYGWFSGLIIAFVIYCIQRLRII